MRRLLFFAVLLVLPWTALAQKNVLVVTPADCAGALQLLEEGGTAAPAKKLPLSYFGVGIGAEEARGVDRIAEAGLVADEITILDDDNTVAGPVLEAHALVFTISKDWAVRGDDGRIFVTEKRPCSGASEFPTIATGPFAMLRVGENEIVQSFGVGWMVGFRLKQSDSSLNIGVAYTLQPEARTLASGFEEGQPLPTGATEIRFRETDGKSIALIVSFGW